MITNTVNGWGGMASMA